MRTESAPTPQRSPFRIPIWLGFCLFLAIALFFLWEEHEAHILGALPYVLLLLCPLIHLFMHRGHGGHERGGHERDGHERGGHGHGAHDHEAGAQRRKGGPS